MKNYRINKNTYTNPNRNNEVHSEDCKYYSDLTNYEFLGSFSTCQNAITLAKAKGYRDADGCVICCPSCHKG